MLWRCLFFFILVVSKVSGHGDPSVAALVSRDAGEPLVARFNLDLAVFFKGRVAPDWKWISEQSEEDLKLLKGDLDEFLRKLYVFSEPGTYSFPMLGGDPGVVREIAPGIALPDGHVMPVFTSENLREAAVWVSASEGAVPLVLVKQVDGKRDRRAVILFPGEEREVFPAVEPVIEIDPALFEMEEFEPDYSWREKIAMGWTVLRGREFLPLIAGFLFLACIAVSPASYWFAVGMVGLGLVVGEHPWTVYFNDYWIFIYVFFIVGAAIVTREGSERNSSIMGGFIGIALGTLGAGVVAQRIEDPGFATVGAILQIAVGALAIQAVIGWLWQKEKTPRWLATWGVWINFAGVIAIVIWLRPF